MSHMNLGKKTSSAFTRELIYVLVLISTFHIALYVNFVF